MLRYGRGLLLGSSQMKELQELGGLKSETIMSHFGWTFDGLESVIIASNDRVAMDEHGVVRATYKRQIPAGPIG